MRLIELVRTTSFRLALTFLVLFSIAAASLFAFVAWQTSDFISQRTDEWLLKEMSGLQDVPPDVIRTRLVARQANGLSLERSFALFDANGKLLAGSDIPLPSNAASATTPFDFKVRVGDRRLPFRGVVRRLEHGEQLLIAQGVAEQHEFNEQLSNALLLGAVVTAVLGLFGAAFVGAGSIRRIERITRSARMIMDGDLAQRLPTGRAGGDIDRLAAVVNDMLEEIEHLMHEVKGVCDNIAHDMRTPLTRMLAGLERARRRAVTVEDYGRYVDEAVVELQGILKTFSALLRISEVEDGIRRSGFLPVDLAEIAQDAMEFYEPFAEERDVALSYRNHLGSAVTLSGDSNLLFEAIGNLIDNAIKFTPAGGRATVTLEKIDGAIRLIVEDTGCGIPPTEAEAVLRRFHRAEPSRHTPGNGLGLSLVSAIARLHGMALGIEQPAQGSRIVLVIPMLTPKLL
ncbi:HAMP domain-containing protein [Rhizobium sp. VS19-DR104.2]|uniref:sensor histidine kinase n=1 Tax=unclassified Rhizobium TaxID=2613769 RepID=UPI001C5BBEE2|nr:MULTISPECIES: ATP-binding protein [unclassified Rhizobium]MBZ5763393.1 HAMP domain-containing protein [Rhizobium sp. VS19-DR96]MBZ5769288.1 HAMP domain-containing protein [Rhizobium sp. VS19-DR129.2]MBZ5776835.1 HAMP domain-containing protein [Rhizobium sp. VS19-DRK62.2]MBZ5787945.1 HAMP domain-containing protein [Rhizobium sp. VS19-DR121]MBZ5805414.1 HAMP domain-containing protein [Rhizobium sp. VS19-DR181]